MFHVFPTSRHYLQPSTESSVLKFKSTLQSVFYTRALAILIVHKASNSAYYYALPLWYWVLHISPTIPVSISTKSPMNLVYIMLIYNRCFNYSFAVLLRFHCWCLYVFVLNLDVFCINTAHRMYEHLAVNILRLVAHYWLQSASPLVYDGKYIFRIANRLSTCFE